MYSNFQMDAAAGPNPRWCIRAGGSIWTFYLSVADQSPSALIW